MTPAHIATLTARAKTLAYRLRGAKFGQNMIAVTAEHDALQAALAELATAAIHQRGDRMEEG